MTTTLPTPRSRSRITSGGIDIHALKGALDTEVDGEIRFDDGSRATYSTDASNYRQVPPDREPPYETTSRAARNGRGAVHLAELLAAGLRGTPIGKEPEQAIAVREGKPSRIPARVLAAAKNALPSPRP